MKNLRVGVLGATGMVGQNYISLLDNHPWFDVAYVAASPESAGKIYAEAVKGRWHMDKPIPFAECDLIVGDANNVEDALGKCDFVFSALELKDKKAIQSLEESYAYVGLSVVSNASAHRWTEDVPMIIPEINPDHKDILKYQMKNRGWKGFIVTKPNCSIQSYVLPLHALRMKGYNLRSAIVTTAQAVSGAGHPGISSNDIIDNLIPYINGEDEKSEREPFKIFGYVEGTSGKIINDGSLAISARCNRVNVRHGHMAWVNLKFDGKVPELEDIINIWISFRGEPQEFELPSAPKRPIIYNKDLDRPQPRLDRDNENGMAVTVGNLSKCNVLDIKFTGLSHNTIRGAAGGAIETAELLAYYDFLKSA